MATPDEPRTCRSLDQALAEAILALDLLAPGEEVQRASLGRFAEKTEYYWTLDTHRHLGNTVAARRAVDPAHFRRAAIELIAAAHAEAAVRLAYEDNAALQSADAGR
ncbi:MAG TPA: hypothetical protein VF041_23150 [Gemmatimonadaceae bacterium]